MAKKKVEANVPLVEGQVPPGLPFTTYDEMMTWTREQEVQAMARIKAARFGFIMHHPFFACIAMDLRLRVAWNLPTAGVDDIHLFYNPSFINGLTDKELDFVMAHEVLHVAFLHSFRRKGRDPKKWNVACDFAINYTLVNCNIGTQPAGTLIDPQYAGMMSEQIYEMIPDSLMQKIEKGQPNKGGKPGTVVFGDGPSCPDMGGAGGVMDPQKEEGDGKEQDHSTLASRHTKAEERVKSAHNSAKNQGRLPEELDRLIDAAMVQPPNWEDILRQFIAKTVVIDVNWRRPHKSMYQQGYYIPSPHRENKPHLVLMMDTSGSIDDETLGAFQTNVNAIVQDVRPEKVTVIWFTAQVEHIDEYEIGDEIVLKSRWSGGTDYHPPFEVVRNMEEQPAAVIMFTDLEVGSYPDELDIPTLFANYNKHRPDGVAPYGETVQITN